ncbi:hypothetical protein BDM02DRAFT_3132890, partial [Thelephora ganbajun]
SFHPALSRLAFSHSERILVWDARHSKFLLNEDASQPRGTSFSSDGRFFMHATPHSAIYLWKESPTGYVLYRKLNRETGTSHQLMSPNGESTFAFGFRAIQLSRTVDPTTSFSRKQGHAGFIVEFSPDETLAAVVRFMDNIITVLDLKSGDPLSIIDTGMGVHGQRVAGSTVAAFGPMEVVTWNLPARDHVLNTKANVNNSIQTATPRVIYLKMPFRPISISPDLHTIATEDTSCFGYHLDLHDVPTGQYLGSVPMRGERCGRPWFTPDGREVWYITDEGEANGLAIVEDSEFGVIKLEQLGPTNQPPSTPPWLSSRGYKITDDGWILGISGKRLLRLPPRWRSSDTNRTWSGRFLALLHGTLPEAVILELEE